ncbi:MAG: NUDIX hydrolase [Candidatus Cloacimonetes bacterium]|nr:NUDIX hydrolase [Candidatus Cloacimonadota bacterium]
MKFEVKNRKLLINEYFKVEKVKVAFDYHNSARTAEAERFNLIRGVAVSALLYHKEKDAVLLVKQFRYSTAEAGYPWLMELPAGLTDDDEMPDQAIERELIEETGYHVTGLKEIQRFFVAPGCTDEEIILYYGEISEADKVAPGGGLAIEHEDIDIIFLPVAELADYITTGKIRDSKSIIGFYWLINYKNIPGK